MDCFKIDIVKIFALKKGAFKKHPFYFFINEN